MASPNPAVAEDTPVNVKIAIHGKDENRKFKLSLNDCQPNLLTDKLRSLLQIPPSQETVFERYSDSAATFVTLDGSDPSVYKQLNRAARSKSKLRFRVTITDKVSSKPEESKTTSVLPDRLTSRKYVHPFVSDLSNKELAPSARLSTLVDVKTASEVPSTTTLAASTNDQVEDQTSARMTQPGPYFWPITDNSEWSESTKANFVKELKQETKEALRNVHDAIASRHASNIGTAHGPNEEATSIVHRYTCAREKCRAEMSGLLNEPAAPPPSSASRQRAYPNFTICCNNCDFAIPDAHWHCSICDHGDFDLCQDCINQGFTCDDEEHWLIKRSVVDGKVVNSKTETIAPKKSIKTEEPEEEKEIPGAFTSHAKTESIPVVADLSRTCNQCVQVFEESKFVTCTVCDDYDLCIPCHVALKHGHHPSHGFAPASEATVLSKVATDYLSPGRNERHWAVCDGCEKDIHGVRYKCLDCPDWDFCSDCKKDSGKTHPNHALVPLYEHFVTPRRIPQEHVGIYCDGELCEEKNCYIVGDRYKCTVCDDTDFCASCEALPRSSHNRTHPLIKLKTPVRNVTVSTFTGKADGTPLYTMGDQHPQTSSKATETNAPAPSANAATQVQTIAEVKPVEPTVQQQSKGTATPPKPADLAAEVNAHFVSDTISDGAIMAPGTQFFQAWTLHNPGPHSWPAGCSVCFIGGDGMLDVDPNHPSHITQIRKAIKTNTVEHEVKVGDSAVFKVAMRAPEREGRAISYWRLKMADGTPFGHKLWCDINVKKESAKPEEATTKHIEDIAKHQPKVEDEADAAAGETNLATSKMIFPKLEKESPASSITQAATASESETVAAPVPAPVEDLLDVESLELDDDDEDSDEGFLTDEEYELVASGDEVEEAKNGRK